MSALLLESVQDLINLQTELLLLMAVGLLLAKFRVLTKETRKILSDFSFSIFLPCSILKSYLTSMDISVLKNCSLLLMVATLLQVLYVVINKVCYRRQPAEHVPFLRYMTLCSNSGFLGAAISQGLYGDFGLLYNSIFMLPQRIFMWTIGMSYFRGKEIEKGSLLKAIFHPCLSAMYIGLVLTLTGITLPAVVQNGVKSIGDCMIPVAMLITGSILADMNPKDFLDWESVYFSVIRLFGLPMMAYLCCKWIPMDEIAKSIAVLMAGMPAATVTVLFAAKYNGDVRFATKCVVLTTMLSIITIPLWAIFMAL